MDLEPRLDGRQDWWRHLYQETYNAIVTNIIKAELYKGTIHNFPGRERSITEFLKRFWSIFHHESHKIKISLVHFRGRRGSEESECTQKPLLLLQMRSFNYLSVDGKLKGERTGDIYAKTDTTCHC
jgi:hypothetical protein